MHPLRERIHFLGTHSLQRPARESRMGCVHANISNVDAYVDNYSSVRHAVTSAVSNYHENHQQSNISDAGYPRNLNRRRLLTHDTSDSRPSELQDFTHTPTSPPVSVFEYRAPIPHYAANTRVPEDPARRLLQRVHSQLEGSHQGKVKKMLHARFLRPRLPTVVPHLLARLKHARKRIQHCAERKNKFSV